MAEENKSKIKNENFFQISGWMINELKLKGNTLMVYAIIYGFSQDNESYFSGSRKYLCDFTGATKRTIDACLEELIDKNYIIKYSEKINDITHNKYKVNIDVVNCASGVKIALGSKETAPNNIDNNKDINNKNINMNNNTYNLKEKIEKKKIVDDSVIVFNYYLDKAIELGYAKNHIEPTKITLVHIKTYLKEHSIETMKQTIDRYFTVINDVNYFFDTYWNVEKFFKQKNAFNDFLEDGIKWINYVDWKNKQFNNDEEIIERNGIGHYFR